MEYLKWTPNQVSKWLRKKLILKNISSNDIDIFLKEFSTKCVSGAMLDDFANDNLLLVDLRKEFSKKNQAFGIWLVVKNSIQELQVLGDGFEGR